MCVATSTSTTTITSTSLYLLPVHRTASSTRQLPTCPSPPHLKGRSLYDYYYVCIQPLEPSVGRLRSRPLEGLHRRRREDIKLKDCHHSAHSARVSRRLHRISFPRGRIIALHQPRLNGQFIGRSSRGSKKLFHQSFLSLVALNLRIGLAPQISHIPREVMELMRNEDWSAPILVESQGSQQSKQPDSCLG